MLPKVSRGFSFFGSGGPLRFDDKKVDGSATSSKSSPSLKLQTDRDVYRPGESVLVTLEICNPEPIREIAEREHEANSICSLLVEKLAFELKGIEKLDTQWFATQKPLSGSKQRRGEQVFLDCSTPSIISNQIISSGSTKTYIVRTELPEIIPPSYRGATIRYLYYVRTTLSGRWFLLENGHSNIERKDLIQLCWEMAPRAIDVGWMYCTKINNNRLQTKCNFCDACHYGGGVTRHKQHLAGGYANVQKCTKCPLEISRKMQEHLARSRAKGNQREDDDEGLTEELMEDIDEYRGSDVGPDDEDAEMVAAMRASREEARAHEWEMRHGMRRSQSYRPGEGSGSGTPSSRRKEKSERVEAFCRSASVKEMFDMFKDSGKGKMKSTDKGKKKKSPDIRDMADPAAYRPRDASQRRIEESLKSHSLRARMGRAISRWFHSALIPAHKAKDPHFKAMVREIQRCGPNVTPPTPYEISGTYLDEVVVEVKEYIERFKEKWPEYGVTIMCDGWSGPTRLSIINFLVFCDGRTIFHKSINASAEIKDAAYLYRLMDEVVEEIGEENVVQIVTDNAANFKKAGLSLMQKRQHIYWTPCAAHCIDLIFKDIGEIKKIQDLVSDARRITNFIYNHSWVLALMRSHTLGDLVRPASTRFATNYVALSSLLERMDGLVQMFTSQDWFCSTYASSEPGRYVQDLVTSTRFWAKIRRVNGLMQPLFSILREVDGDKDQTMGILMDRMLRAMMTVVQLNTSESQKVAKIIDSRLGGMLLQDIHRAASYLNPTLQYQDARLGYDVEILDALRRVINRMEPDTIRAAAAVDEEARAPLQIWITQKTSSLLNEEGQSDGISPAMTIQTDIYWKEKDADSEWARANETFDGVEEGYESSRDEVSSVSSYNPAKGNLERAFGSSLSLQSSATRSSNKDLSYPQGERASLSSYVALPELSVTEVLYDPVGDVPSPPKKLSVIISPSQQRKLTNPVSPDDDVRIPSALGSVEPVASEGFIRGRSYNIRLDDQVLLRYTPKNSDSTYYFSDMIGGTLTLFHEEGARRCLEVSITLETSETIAQRFVHPSRRNSPTITKAQSDYHEVVADLAQTSFLFSIPTDGPMSFSTPLVSLQWALRFEFFTTPKYVDWTRYEHPLLIEGRDKGEWVLPITVHAPPLRSQAAHSRTERSSSLEPLWVRG